MLWERQTKIHYARAVRCVAVGLKGSASRCHTPSSAAPSRRAQRPRPVRQRMGPHFERPPQRFQSAIKMFVSPPAFAPRLDAHKRCLPSRLNMGNPSNSGWVVTCSRPLPSKLTT